MTNTPNRLTCLLQNHIPSITSIKFSVNVFEEIQHKAKYLKQMYATLKKKKKKLFPL